MYLKVYFSSDKVTILIYSYNILNYLLVIPLEEELVKTFGWLSK